ncbi:hypothetical protein L3556_05820 [Candidatus Synechococcus calcipolaris G9]|uniref:Uncharacterized protein n=1 Tax=Candidatus Synechococcus calcipolaris G9 TaxID=1497997 RepID=A0ABT6EXC7_9SYNE|nr:hypothetical protein [Candidatus Synechococcus calcipolaris]MDG2990451.1 hypothetical protein [Candidatus Synechococcus calcipolaris G9]
MERLEHSHNRLVLRDRPWLFWIMGVVFIGMITFPLFTIGKHEVLCRRFTPTDGQCRLTSRYILAGTRIQRVPIQAIQEARVDSKRSRNSRSYQVQLITREGIVRFGTYNSGAQWHNSLASRINQFVTNPQIVELQEERDDRWFALGISSIFICSALVMVLGFGKTLILDFDKTQGTLTMTYKGVFGQTVREYNLQYIHAVDVESARSSKGGMVYGITLVMNSGDRVPIRSYKTSNRKPKEETAADIRTFLGLKPF